MGKLVWSQALGLQTLPTTNPEDKNYVSLKTDPNDLDIEVQKVDHPSRVHLDIETDNIVAEVTRLEGLGAFKIANIRDWVVMEAPTGQRFCVVPVVSADFESRAHSWGD